MGIGNKISTLVVGLQQNAKLTAVGLAALCLKVFSALVVGLTFALAGQELIGYGNFSFVLMLVVVSSLLVRALWNFSLVAVVVFDLIAVLLALLFRMYLLMAP